MSPLFRAISTASGILGLIVALEVTSAAEVVTGRVEGMAAKAASPPPRRGYVKTRVTAAAEATFGHAELAVFLRVKESLPLEPAEPSVLALSGLRLTPKVVSCAVDGRIQLRNDDRQPATFVVGDDVLGVVPPGEMLIYECTAGTSGDELRDVKVREWPRLRGAIYVGEVGAPGAIDDEGRFEVEVSKGTYILRIVGIHGVVHEQEVEADVRRRDVGIVQLGAEEAP